MINFEYRYAGRRASRWTGHQTKDDYYRHNHG
jgi:hypothetical protein